MTLEPNPLACRTDHSGLYTTVSIQNIQNIYEQTLNLLE